jgi:hypothetical protein
MVFVTDFGTANALGILLLGRILVVLVVHWTMLLLLVAALSVQGGLVPELPLVGSLPRC